jgi:hypothetical protein
MFKWGELDRYDRIFVAWAFIFQIVLIIHFALRKSFFDIYTQRFGWIVYALCIPAVIISITLWRSGRYWTLWLGGFLFFIYAVFGYWVDYVLQIPWRNPLQLSILFPYVFLYLATVMFYWWPLWRLSRRLWVVYTILFIIATILNTTSH